MFCVSTEGGGVEIGRGLVAFSEAFLIPWGLWELELDSACSDMCCLLDES
jgi:hypothetical protein